MLLKLVDVDDHYDVIKMKKNKLTNDGLDNPHVLHDLIQTFSGSWRMGIVDGVFKKRFALKQWRGNGVNTL